MISQEHQIVIIAYLAAKLNLKEQWFVMPNEHLFGLSPQETVRQGSGDRVISFLETRLGLLPGVAF